MSPLLLKLQIIYTAILSGMMLMYVITIGSYFSFLLKHKMLHAFRDYSIFRKNTRVQLHHTIALIGQVVLSILSLIINYKMGLVPLLVGVLVPIGMLVIHLLTGFAKVENRINAAEPVDEKMMKKYLFWNIPLHILYTVLYGGSALFLLTLFQ